MFYREIVYKFKGTGHSWLLLKIIVGIKNFMYYERIRSLSRTDTTGTKKRTDRLDKDRQTTILTDKLIVIFNKQIAEETATNRTVF